MIEVKILDEVEELEVTGGDLVVTEGDIDLVHADKKLNLPSKPDAANPTINFDDDTGFYESGANVIGIVTAGAIRWRFIGGALTTWSTGGIYLAAGDPTATIPIYTFNDDTNTGMGHAGPDALSLIAGGVEAWRGTEAAGAITHVLTDDVGITGDLDVDGDLNTDGILTTPSNETIDTNGALSGSTSLTYIDTSTNNEGTFTFGDGVTGQEKFIVLISRIAVDAVITPSNLWNGTTITFDTIGETIHLVFMSGKWAVMGGTATVA